MPTAQEILSSKSRALATLQSTFKPDVLDQGSQGRPFQQMTAAPFPNYPAPGAAAVVLLNFQVPSGCIGVLTGLAIVNVGNVAPAYTDGDGNVIFRVLKNGAGVQGLEALNAQVGSLAQPQQMGLVLVENDIITVTVEVPAGKISPGSNAGAMILGFLNIGGQGARPIAAVPGAAGAAAAAAPATTTGTTSGGTTTGGTSGGYSGGTSGGTGGCFMWAPFRTRLRVMGNHRWELRLFPQADWIQLVARNRWRTNCTPGQRWLTPDRGLVAARDLRPGDLIVTIKGEIALAQVTPFRTPGVRAEVSDLDAGPNHAGRLVEADGFIAHNTKAAPEGGGSF